MKNIIITESEKKEILQKYQVTRFDYLYEQNAPTFASIFPPNVIKSVKDTSYQIGQGTNLIYLSRRDPKTGQLIPKTTFTYKVSGSYKVGFAPINFDVQLRNFKRGDDGSLELEARPKNKLVFSAMKKFISDKNLTSDGWLLVLVKVDKLNKGLDNLLRNQGSKALIDAGNGVTITLENYKK